MTRHVSNPYAVRGKLKVLDLFSGIGGFSLGLERTGGFETVAFCEIEEYPRRVLAKHWPGVPIYEDVRELTGARLAADGIAVDVICGGFPCQDISTAGNRVGLEGARSGLWSEYGRLIGDLQPAFVIVENVPGLLSLGMGTVLGDLATLGYDAQWDCVPAAAIGAPHRRDRVWLVAHPASGRRAGRTCGHAKSIDAGAPGPHVANARRRRVQSDRGAGKLHGESSPAGGQTQSSVGISSSVGCGCQNVPDAAGHGRLENVDAVQSPSCRGPQARQPSGQHPLGNGQWVFEPDVGRVAHGVPARVDRLRALGNAVVPQIPEMIGRAILEAMQ